MHGTDGQKARWLPPIVEGEMLGAWAVTEPHAGSDVANITTKAERTATGWRLNGRKMFITNAAIADCLLILCRTGGSGIRENLTTFVVPMDSPGIEVSQALEKMGLRSSPTCELILDDVEVPDTDRLGTVGHGWQIGMDVFNYERMAIPAISAGMCTRALDLAAKYAADRTAFGSRLNQIGPVKSMLADIASGVLECRLLYRHAAELVDAGRPATVEGSIGKLVSARLANAAASLSLQIHGGYGYIREYEVERLYRDARLSPSAGGQARSNKRSSLTTSPANPAGAEQPPSTEKPSLGSGQDVGTGGWDREGATTSGGSAGPAR